MTCKPYKVTHFGVSVDHTLSLDEIAAVHRTWRSIRDDEAWQGKSWNYFKDSLGLDFDIKAMPNWTIADKNKWLWAKLKYNL
jgi:hypothetical protein